MLQKDIPFEVKKNNESEKLIYCVSAHIKITDGQFSEYPKILIEIYGADYVVYVWFVYLFVLLLQSKYSA